MSAASLLGGVGRNRIDGALEVVADADDVARQPRDGVLGRLLLLALGALADVLDLGVRPQQPVLEVGGFGAQRGDDVVGLSRQPARPAPALRVAAPLAAGCAGVPASLLLDRNRLAVCWPCVVVPRFELFAPGRDA